jgi:hypothetical protein
MSEPRAVACARANGVEARPAAAAARHVHVRRRWPTTAGPDGTALLRRAVRGPAAWLRPGGALLLELGGRQAELLRSELTGFGEPHELRDEDGDVRAIAATRR